MSETAGRLDPDTESSNRQGNPFDGPQCRAHSSFCAVVDEELLMPETVDGRRERANRRTFELLQEFILQQPYPCVGAQAAFNQQASRFGTYPCLTSPEATAGLARDLFAFTRETSGRPKALMTFLAVFDGPPALSEKAFERLLWEQLAALHLMDRRHYEWDPAVSSDPDEATFAFSFAGHGFYVIGMHPGSSRPARRFSRPMLVFNPHDLFKRLRDRGAYAKMQRLVRERDAELHGSVNPMLQDFGEASEARQYSGRAVDEDWSCPFHDAVDQASNRK